MKSNSIIPWIIVLGIGWVLLPFLVPLLVLYIIVRIVNAVLIGKSIQEVHRES